MEDTITEVEAKVEPGVGQPEAEEDVKILAFLCNWCSYAGADLAGVSRLQYPPNVVDIRVMCTGTISPYFVLKAFQEGIDGVLIAGCHIGDCHYDKGNYATAKRFRVLKDIMLSMGIDPRRLRLEWVSAAEGAKFQDVITSFTEQVRAAGKSPLAVSVESDVEAGAGAAGASEPLKITVGDWKSGPAEEAVARSVREALSGGEAAAAVVLTVRDGEVVPRVVKSADDAVLDEVFAGDVRYPMTSFAVMVLPLVEGKLALPVRECDRRMIVELAKHNQIDPARLVLLGIPCSQDVADACGCDHPFTPEDMAIAPKAAEPAEATAPEGSQAEEASVRLDFWMENFSRCIKCMGCRNVCPMCYCVECALDNPDIVGPDSKPPDIPIFHLIRAADMADRCVDCGMCEAICPARIPLRQLYRQARAAVKEAFDYDPGVDPDAVSPVKMLGEPSKLGGMHEGYRAK
jgi:formate dehydrogenase (coenzyme F420) beta subunit